VGANLVKGGAPDVSFYGSHFHHWTAPLPTRYMKEIIFWTQYAGNGIFGLDRHWRTPHFREAVMFPSDPVAEEANAILFARAEQRWTEILAERGIEDPPSIARSASWSGD
jgi:hypothetical protein